MLLNKIVLEDFGVYGGRNEFDFRTEHKKPIVLYGGTNGAGKTTLFDSIMLCLYGQQSFEQKISQKQYHKNIYGQIHRHLGMGKLAQDASITVEFEFARRGTISEYRVVRSWQNIDGAIEEDLLIYKREKGQQYVKLDSIDKSGWQAFIDQMMPRGIARLFFFDGEKIKNIAESGDEQNYIHQSFDMLLGLDLVQQLSDDIGIYLLRNSKGQTQKILEEIEQQTAEKTNAEKRLERIREKQVDINAQITRIRYQIKTQEEQFAKIGGQFARNRESLAVKRSKIEADLETIKRQIRDMCSDALPLCLIPEQLEELRLDMNKEEKRIQNNTEQKILEETFSEILQTANSSSFLPSCDEPTRKALVSELECIFQKKKNMISDSQKIILDLSPSEMIRAKQIIDEINESAEQKIKELAESYNKIDGELKKIKTSLEISPQDDEIGPAMSEISKANRKLGELEGELENLTNMEAQEKSMVAILNSQIRQNISKRNSDRRFAGGIDMGPAIQDALEEYSTLLRSKKIEILQKYILEGLQALLHKKDFVEKISIDPDTFEVGLYKQNGDEITRQMLSKGELQMYATAIVWGLAKTSGRTLPFVIDTPLARLDREHRMNIVENFYPTASHQTIILSTDSEVIGAYYDKLKPYIAKTYTMNFDSENGRTITTSGYFQEGQHAIKV